MSAALAAGCARPPPRPAPAPGLAVISLCVACIDKVQQQHSEPHKTITRTRPPYEVTRPSWGRAVRAPWPQSLHSSSPFVGKPCLYPSTYFFPPPVILFPSLFLPFPLILFPDFPPVFVFSLHPPPAFQSSKDYRAAFSCNRLIEQAAFVFIASFSSRRSLVTASLVAFWVFEASWFTGPLHPSCLYTVAPQAAAYRRAVADRTEPENDRPTDCWWTKRRPARRERTSWRAVA